jgi:nicotinate-nucleotide adenylyltransferase
MPARPRTGVFGGTFNPIHLGHLRAAEEVLECLGLERMIFVLSARPPHKSAEDDDPIAPAKLRLEWLRRAVSSNPRFKIDALEVNREGPSYLVDTLRSLGARTAPELPVFALGSDAFREIETWREPGTLFTLAHFAVVTRPPLAAKTLRECLPENRLDAFELASDGRSARHREAGTSIRLVEITALDISASAIRSRIRAGRSVRYLLPESVHDAVHASGCYASGGDSRAKEGRDSRGREGCEEDRKVGRNEGRRKT